MDDREYFVNRTDRSPIGVGSKAEIFMNDVGGIEISNLSVSELCLLVVGLGALVEHESISATTTIAAIDLRSKLGEALDSLTK